MKGFRVAFIFALVATLSMLTRPFLVSAQSLDRSQDIKAAVYYYILKFIVWSDSPKRQPNVITVCIVNDPVFATKLSAVLASKNVSGSGLVVKYLPTSDVEANVKNNCDVIHFNLSGDANDKLKLITLAETNHNLFSTCSVDSPIPQACYVQIFERDNKAKIAVNRKRLARSRFKVSSELLDLAVDASDSEGD